VCHILVTEVELDRPCILAGIGQLVAGGVADHVRMNLKGQAGLLAGSLHHSVEAVPGEWRATTFGRERERRLGLLPPGPRRRSSTSCTTVYANVVGRAGANDFDANVYAQQLGFERVTRLEPISKSPEEDNEAGELDEAEKVVGVVFPADEDATLPLYPGEEALDQPTSHVTT
jgi:hypothetical protein